MTSCHLVRRLVSGLWPAAAALLSLLTFATPALADLAAADRALARGDYATAYREALPLAEQGDKNAKIIVLFAKKVLEIQKAEEEAKNAPPPTGLEAGIEAYSFQKWETAVRELAPLADAGDAEAQYYLGRTYRDLSLFSGDEADRERGYRYLLMAAKQRHVNAQSFLGSLYLNSGDPEELDKGIAWVLRAFAARQTYRDAGILAAAYCYGPDYQRDANLAAAWLTLNMPDRAFAQPPAVLDEHWEEVRNFWRSSRCFDDAEITKEFVRAAHRRAIALGAAYGISRECLVNHYCPDRVN